MCSLHKGWRWWLRILLSVCYWGYVECSINVTSLYLLVSLRWKGIPLWHDLCFFLPWAMMNLQCFTLRLLLKLSLLSGDSFKYYCFSICFWCGHSRRHHVFWLWYGVLVGNWMGKRESKWCMWDTSVCCWHVLAVDLSRPIHEGLHLWCFYLCVNKFFALLEIPGNLVPKQT